MNGSETAGACARKGIGVALDPGGDRMFVTDLGGSLSVGAMDGSHWREVLLVQGNLTGIAYTEVAAEADGLLPEDEGSPCP